MNVRKAVFYGLLVAGVGLCVGGIFVPPLIPVGAALIAGAVSVGQNLVQSNRSEARDRPQVAASENKPPQCDDNIEIDVHIEHRPHLGFASRQSLNEPVNQVQIESKENARNYARKDHKSRP